MGPSVQYVQTYLNQLQAVIAKMPIEAVDQVITILMDSAKRGSKVFICGNGGSASTASHFACDLGKNTMVAGAPRSAGDCSYR